MTTFTPEQQSIVDSLVDVSIAMALGKIPFEEGLQAIQTIAARKKTTFDELKPQALIGDQYVIRDPVGGFVYDTCKGNQERACWHCGSKTVWFDIDFSAYLCSLECSRVKWTEYSETARKGSVGDG